MLMYGIYNAETLEKLINTVHCIHNTTSSHEKTICRAAKLINTLVTYGNTLGLQYYSINSPLYLRTVQGKYVSLYKEMITQLCIYATAIRVLTKGYLTISLITPLKLREILSEVKIAIRKTNPDYDLVIERLHLYYDMKIITFGIDKERNLIIQFPVFIQPYTQLPLILYQVETVTMPIIDQNKQAHSYTHLQIDKPYIALNSETYITIRPKELRTCKRIGYKFYCEELFVVKHKSKYSCKSAIYFNLDSNTIKDCCKFIFIKTKLISLLLC